MGLQRKVLLEELDKTPELSELPTNTLAKLLARRYPEVYLSVESARSAIRNVRGEHSDAKKKYKVAKYETTPEERKERQATSKLLNLPSEGEKELAKYTLPTANKRVLILSDIHIPYHDEDALEHALNFGLENNVDTILINGDLIDMYHCSSFEKDPRVRGISYELDLTRAFFEQLRELFPNQKIIFKLGNHEARWERFLKIKAPELLDIHMFKLDEVLGLNKWNIDFLENDVLIEIADLLVLHGHETGKSFGSAVNPARSLFNKIHRKSLAGHNHQTSEFLQNQTGKETIEVYSTGCLCELHPKYARINKWNHGFAFVEVKNKRALVQNIRI